VLERMFYEMVRDDLQNRAKVMDMKGTVHLETMVKHNDIILTGVTFNRGDGIPCPIVYLNHYYEEYDNGASYVDMIKELFSLMTESPEAVRMSFPDSDYEKVRGKVYTRICGYDQNQKWLEDKVHEKHGDFAYTYQLFVGEMDHAIGTVAICSKHLKYWGISEETLKQDAVENDKKEEVRLVDMKEMMFEQIGFWKAENLYEMEDERWPEDDNPILYVLTNKNRTYGASLLARPDVLEHTAKILGGDYYVLPSSIHETILISKKNSPPLDKLLKMVYEINRSTVDPAEVLSDHIQYYDHKNKLLMNAQEYFAKQQMTKNGMEGQIVVNRQRDCVAR